MEIQESLLNKAVYVLTKGGFHKFGILMQVEENFILLKYFSGKDRLIPKGDIIQLEKYRARGDRHV